jgi:nickel/cobalt exporter
MTDLSLVVLLQTAALIGLLHTLAGPDHYVPFVAMARAGGWSLTRTVMITTLCGLAHVLSSVALGALGIAFGWSVGSLESLEAWRGDVAGWLLLGFGIAYTAWGVRRAVRNRPHSHLHVHTDGTVHAHEHTHSGEHAHPHTTPFAPLPPHPHDAGRTANRMTPWVLFTIFVFGPCEPLIPVLMYPAARLDVWGIVLAALVFGVVTIATMLTIVTLGYAGLTRLPLAGMERYSHAAAGGALTLCAAAMKFGL